jgi:hypothetical protein
MRCLGLIVVAFASPTLANGQVQDDGLRKERVEVGQTIEREVGIAIGVMCDEDVVTAEMKTKNPELNVVVFEGKREGKTLCRVGTDPNRASYVYEITVTKKAKPKPRRS